MLPLRQYTLEDYYKFYRLISPLIDKAIEENFDLAKHGVIRVCHDQLREALQVAFPEESNAVPSIFRRFVELMIKEMHCKEIAPCEERTGVYWYDVKPYLNMRELNPEVHQAINEYVPTSRSKLRTELFQERNLMEIYPIRGEEEDIKYALEFIKSEELERRLGGRAAKILRKAGISKVSDLLDITAEELLHLEGFGKICLREIRSNLGCCGFYLSGDKEWFEANKVWDEKYRSYKMKTC